MKQIGIVVIRELESTFDSLMAYIMIVAFLGFSGFFTWLYGSDVFFVGQASLQSFFYIAYWTLFFFIPALTMKLVAEEKKTGTLEMILTKPVTDWQFLWGKFLATLLLIIIALLLTLPYYITVTYLGKADHGAIIIGYLALILMSASYISIGIFTSSLTNNQIVAFLLALLIGIFFHIIFSLLAANLTGITGSLIQYLSISTHFDSMSRGVIDSKNLIYFGSIILLGMVGAEAILAKRNMD